MTHTRYTPEPSDVPARSLREAIRAAAGELLPETVERIVRAVDAALQETLLGEDEALDSAAIAEFLGALRGIERGDLSSGLRGDAAPGLAPYRRELAAIDHGLAGIDGVAAVLHAGLFADASGSATYRLGELTTDRLFYGLRALAGGAREALGRAVEAARAAP